MTEDRQVVEILVPKVLHDERIDRLISIDTDRSRSIVGRAIADGYVSCNESLVESRSLRVSEGDFVVASLPPVKSMIPQPNSDVEVSIVHEDPLFWVVDKQIGLVVHPGPGHLDDTLCNGLLAIDPSIVGVGGESRPGIVHRLDRDTSGLMVVARTQDSYEALSDAIRYRAVSREYRVLVDGWPEVERGIIDAPIGRSRRNSKRMTVAADGKEARTSYWREAVFNKPRKASFLGAKLETGRTHQIRVHLQAIGLPVIGDAKYGKVNVLGSRRPMLHSFRLSFTHPSTGTEMSFESPLPDDFLAVLDQLSS